MTDNTNAPEGPRSFAHLLATLGDGDVAIEASDRLHRLTTKLRDETRARGVTLTGKFSIDLSITVDPLGAVEVVSGIKVKEPDPATRRSHMYLTKGANITAENPRQMALGLREVARPADLREALGGTKEGSNA